MTYSVAKIFAILSAILSLIKSPVASAVSGYSFKCTCSALFGMIKKLLVVFTTQHFIHILAKFFLPYLTKDKDPAFYKY